MDWINVNEDIVNLNLIESIVEEDLERSYTKPFLLTFTSARYEYSKAFLTAEARNKYKKAILLPTRDVACDNITDEIKSRLSKLEKRIEKLLELRASRAE